MDGFADITPKTHLLQHLRRTKMQLPSLLGEALDNAFDASARNVRVTVADDMISIEDDGVGVSKGRWLALITLGDHMPQVSTALGRYGVGIKNQAIAAGDYFQLSSVSADGRVTLGVDWEAVELSGRWRIQDPKWDPVGVDSRGTRIRISRLRRCPTVREKDKARAEIERIFYPVIMNDGFSVRFNGELLQPFSDPVLKSAIKEEFLDFSPTKRAWIKAGLVADSESKATGVDLSFKHRVIKPRSNFGCSDYPTNGFFGRVYLSGDWKLSPYKDDLNDFEHGDQLEEWVFSKFKPLLERCRTATMSVRFMEMLELLNSSLPEEIRAVRPKKVQELNRQGRKDGRQGKAPNAPESPTGPAVGSRARAGVLIHWENCADEYGYGRFERGRISRILLAKDNPHIIELMARRDRESARRELYLIAISIMLGAPDQGELPLDGPYGQRFWHLYSQQNLRLPSADSN